MDLEKLIRPNIKNLVPYSSARDEFAGVGEVFLDANENSYGSPSLENANFHRYPDPAQTKIKAILAHRLGLTPADIFLGNGSDEAIDLLLRVFCVPSVDEIIITPPTYGMYQVSARINDVAVSKVLLSDDFQLRPDAVLNAVKPNTKIIFLCSPNNPTGNLLNRADVLRVVQNFGGIVVVDEAYIHFSVQPSLIAELENFENLVILQTFSKAWGLAGLRVGAAFANDKIINLLNRIKPPYNISEIAQQTLLDALDKQDSVQKTACEIVGERAKLQNELRQFAFIKQIYPSDANFLLVKTEDADALYDFVIRRGVVVRNRSTVELCENCLRVTIGTPHENQILLNALCDYQTTPKR